MKRKNTTRASKYIVCRLASPCRNNHTLWNRTHARSGKSGSQTTPAPTIIAIHAFIPWNKSYNFMKKWLSKHLYFLALFRGFSVSFSSSLLDIQINTCPNQILQCLTQINLYVRIRYQRHSLMDDRSKNFEVTIYIYL